LRSRLTGYVTVASDSVSNYTLMVPA
jgi:hypothetical protein